MMAQLKFCLRKVATRPPSPTTRNRSMAHLDKVQKQDNCKIVFSLFLAGNVSLDHSLFWKPCLCRFLNPNLLYSLQQMARRDNTSRSKLNLAKWRTSFFCPGSPHGVSKFWNGFRRVNSYLNHQPLPGALAYAQSAQSKHLSAAQLEWNLQAETKHEGNQLFKAACTTISQQN